MKEHQLLAPLFRAIDKVVFGFEQEQIFEREQSQQEQECENDDEFDVIRSTN